MILFSDPAQLGNCLNSNQSFQVMNFQDLLAWTLFPPVESRRQLRETINTFECTEILKEDIFRATSTLTYLQFF
jgi:hypothetical protein